MFKDEPEDWYQMVLTHHASYQQIDGPITKISYVKVKSRDDQTVDPKGKCYWVPDGNVIEVLEVKNDQLILDAGQTIWRLERRTGDQAKKFQADLDE